MVTERARSTTRRVDSRTPSIRIRQSARMRGRAPRAATPPAAALSTARAGGTAATPASAARSGDGPTERLLETASSCWNEDRDPGRIPEEALKPGERRDVRHQHAGRAAHTRSGWHTAGQAPARRRSARPRAAAAAWEDSRQDRPAARRPAAPSRETAGTRSSSSRTQAVARPRRLTLPSAGSSIISSPPRSAHGRAQDAKARPDALCRAECGSSRC